MDLYSSPMRLKIENRRPRPKKGRKVLGWGEIMQKKNKKMSMKDDCCCEAMPMHPHGRGKALANVAIGLFLRLFGFGYIKDLQTLAMVIGVLMMIRGAIRMMGNW